VTSLFANQRESNLASTIGLVEQALMQLGHAPEARRVNEPGVDQAWRIVLGSATTRIAVSRRAAFPHLRVSSVVMTLDAAVDRPALFAHLLELNASLCGAAFATEGDHVLMVSERSTLDLDLSEVLELIQRVAAYSGDHDDVLVARFGGRAGG